MRLAGAIGTAIGGIAFFFAIIGVFGTGVAIGSLLLFVLGAIAVIRASGGRQA